MKRLEPKDLKIGQRYVYTDEDGFTLEASYVGPGDTTLVVGKPWGYKFLPKDMPPFILSGTEVEGGVAEV